MKFMKLAKGLLKYSYEMTTCVRYFIYHISETLIQISVSVCMQTLFVQTSLHVFNPFIKNGFSYFISESSPFPILGGF